MTCRTALVLLALSASFACKRVPSAREQQGAQIHYDLGVQAHQSGEPQAAYKEFQLALEMDPYFPELHNAMGVLLHLSFRRPEQAIAHYEKALEIRPEFSEVRTNLGNVYLEQGRYDEAIKQYEMALNDMLYPTPYIAQSNLGWARYKKGEVNAGLQEIKAAVTTNPKFCMGYRNLGTIHTEQGNLEEACKQFGKFRDACPEVADAYYREGVCLAKLGKSEKARESFAGCQAKAGTNETLRDDCKRLFDSLQ